MQAIGYKFSGIHTLRLLSLVHSLMMTYFDGKRAVFLLLASTLLSVGSEPLVRPIPCTVDLVLSSGLLAFARHAGFIDACSDLRLAPHRIVGTSSGSLAGSMLASGMSSQQIYEELGRRPPIQLMSPSWRMHRGLFSLRSLIKHLQSILPRDFESLQTPLAVGVFGSSGTYELITQGDLPEAVVRKLVTTYCQYNFL